MKDIHVAHRPAAAAEPLNPRSALGLSVLGLLLAGGIGFWAVHAHQAQAPGLIALTAVDVSGSHTAAQRKQDIGPLEAAVETALPFRTPLRLWQFDSAAREMYNGQPEGGQDLWKAEDELCRYVSHTEGTHVERALTQMLPAIRQAQAGGHPVGILIVWDGDMADVGAVKKAASELAALPNVRAVWLIGVKTDAGLRSETARTFAPLGSRLVISGSLDARDGLEKFRDKVRGN